MDPLSPRQQRSRLALGMWFGYVVFVIYGSLVPLKYQGRSFDSAWEAFQHIPFLHLGVESRADWISNGVLYLPLGFLTAYLLMQTFRRVPRFLLLAVAAALSFALAVGVEFTQLYFPQRTVSLNDILAECIGSVLGLWLAGSQARWFHNFVESFSQSAGRLKKLALEAYAIAYVALALFPYDFYVSRAELAEKISGNEWGWLLAGDSRGLILTSLKLAVEVLLTLPFGFLLARAHGHRVGPGITGKNSHAASAGRQGIVGGPASSMISLYPRAVIVGLLLGMVIEGLQFFMATGVSQGLSVLSRVLGVTAGLALSRHTALWSAQRLPALVRRFLPALASAYLLVMLEINGFFTLSWRSLADAQVQLSQTNFIPFYYHYFTSEAKALFSLGVVALSYTPLAVMAWAHGRTPRFAAWLTLALSAVIEVGKLFSTSTHADPTNLLIACAASWGTVRLLQQLARLQLNPAHTEATLAAFDQSELPSNPAGNGPGAQGPQAPPPWLWMVLAATAIWALTFPALVWILVPVLFGAAALVWRRPVWAFAIIPAALPVFDLAPWSGRFFLDEFDALLLVCLAVAFARVPAAARQRWPADKPFNILLALVMLSFGISTLRGLLPLQWPDANAFISYYSPYNALRIVKGAVWALLVFALFRRLAASGLEVRRPFAWGMCLGLALTVLVIFWERLAFSALLGFSDGYRVTGPFSATNVGGAYVDCFLAAGTPFLIILLLEKRPWWQRLAGALLVLGATYALMVTFSRGGYLSFAVTVAGVMLFALPRSLSALRRGVVLAGLALAMLAVGVPIYRANFMQSRLEAAGADLDFRQTRWNDALAIRDPGLGTALFGMGVGRFPATTYWRSTLNPRPGNYQLVSEAGKTYLRLDSGEAIGVEQFVSLQPGESYVLKMDVRPSRPGAKLVVPICEKWLLTSANCLWPAFDLGQEFGQWRGVEVRFTNNSIPAGPWYAHRPVKLALTYGVPQSTIDIDNLRLETDQGANLLQNGDFSAGLDHWFFATASATHAHWHVHSLYYGLLFDQGWFGLLVLCAFFALALGRSSLCAWRGDALAGATVAALGGMLVSGFLDTQIDAPRILMLLLLLVLLAAMRRDAS